MEAIRLITVGKNQQDDDLCRVSILSTLLLQIYTFVDFCNKKGLGIMDFLLSPTKFLALKPLKAEQFNTNANIHRVTSKKLKDAQDLILTILKSTPKGFEQLFLERQTQPILTIMIAGARCACLIDSVVTTPQAKRLNPGCGQTKISNFPWQ